MQPPYSADDDDDDYTIANRNRGTIAREVMSVVAKDLAIKSLP